MLEKIEFSLNEITRNLDEENFIFDFLSAFDQPKASIKRLKNGDYNQSNNENEIIWKKKIYFRKILASEDVHDLIDEISKKTEILKNNIRFIIVTDFKTFLSMDLKTKETLDIEISNLAKNFNFFLPLTGLEKAVSVNESLIDIKAASKLGKLFDLIIKDNKNFLSNDKYRHGLNIFFTRIIFCFFAEDSGIFSKGLFTNTIKSVSQDDGSDLSEIISKIFLSLNDQQNEDISEYLKKFPYVNGGLFRNIYKTPLFSQTSRKALIEIGALDWALINPDILGSMMQAVVNDINREELGMHYTSVKNILKTIGPLFLNDIIEDFRLADNDIKKLKSLLKKIYKIRIFDPACGSGNFLVIAYKELCRIEIEIFKRLREVDSNEWLILRSGIQLTQFFGIEIDDYAHEASKLSLWIAEHQMNIAFEEILGEAKPTLPLSTSGNIFCGNAIEVDWKKICPHDNEKNTHILGNPPYSGAKKQNQNQKKDVEKVFKKFKSYKNLDYISCWFYLASEYIKNTKNKFAFVSTKSISQGELAGLLWPSIQKLDLEIFFAHKPFVWNNHAKGNAGVTCVIIGVQSKNTSDKFLYDGEETNIRRCKFISPYLVDVDPSVLILRSNTQISGLKEMLMGNMPRDDGNLILSSEERDKLLKNYPDAIKFLKKYVGATELIKNEKRWCLWIKDDDKDEATNIPFIKKRIEKVIKFRNASNAISTRLESKTPHKFVQIQHNPCRAIAIPTTTASRRDYLPIDFVDENTVLSNLVFGLYEPEIYIFGILSSKMHTAWLKTVAGRFGDSYRYSSVICYNSFVFPKIDGLKKKIIEEHVLEILDTREKFSDKNLVQLYDPNLMPLALKKVHDNLDKVIDNCYTNKVFSNVYDRIQFLFNLYSDNIKQSKLL